MKSPTSAVRLKNFYLHEKQRHLQQIETMEREFQRMADALSAQIEEEERRSGISDNGHYAYSIFAKAACARRDNLLHSIENLQERKEAAKLEIKRAEDELLKARKLEERENFSQDNHASPTPYEQEMRRRRHRMIG